MHRAATNDHRRCSLERSTPDPGQRFHRLVTSALSLLVEGYELHILAVIHGT
jgi:hypothetical protein